MKRDECQSSGRTFLSTKFLAEHPEAKISAVCSRENHEECYWRVQIECQGGVPTIPPESARELFLSYSASGEQHPVVLEMYQDISLASNQSPMDGFLYQAGREFGNWMMTTIGSQIDRSGVRVAPGLSLGNCITTPVMSFLNFAERYGAHLDAGSDHAARRACIETLIDVPEQFLPPAISAALLASRIANASAEPYRELIRDMPGDVSDELERWESYGVLKMMGFPSRLLDAGKQVITDHINDSIDRVGSGARPVWGGFQAAGISADLTSGTDRSTEQKLRSEQLRDVKFRIPSGWSANHGGTDSLSSVDVGGVERPDANKKDQSMPDSGVLPQSSRYQSDHVVVIPRPADKKTSIMDNINLYISQAPGGGVVIGAGIKLGLTWATFGLSVAAVGAFYATMKYIQRKENKRISSIKKKLEKYSKTDEALANRLNEINSQFAGRALTTEEELEYYRNVEKTASEAARNLEKEYEYNRGKHTHTQRKSDSWKQYKAAITSAIEQYKQLAQNASADKRCVEFLCSATRQQLAAAIKRNEVRAGFVDHANVRYLNMVLAEASSVLGSKCSGSNHEVVTLCTESLTVLPDQPEILMLRSFAYHEAKEFQLAVLDASTVFRLQPDNFNALMIVLDGNLQLNHTDQVKVIVKENLEKVKDDAEKSALLHTYMGNAAEREKDHPLAWKSYKAALDQDAKSMAALHGLISATEQIEKLDREAYELLLSIRHEGAKNRLQESKERNKVVLAKIVACLSEMEDFNEKSPLQDAETPKEKEIDPEEVAKKEEQKKALEKIAKMKSEEIKEQECYQQTLSLQQSAFGLKVGGLGVDVVTDVLLMLLKDTEFVKNQGVGFNLSCLRNLVSSGLVLGEQLIEQEMDRILKSINIKDLIPGLTEEGEQILEDVTSGTEGASGVFTNPENLKIAHLTCTIARLAQSVIRIVLPLFFEKETADKIDGVLDFGMSAGTAAVTLIDLINSGSAAPLQVLSLCFQAFPGAQQFIPKFDPNDPNAVNTDWASSFFTSLLKGFSHSKYFSHSSTMIEGIKTVLVYSEVSAEFITSLTAALQIAVPMLISLSLTINVFKAQRESEKLRVKKRFHNAKVKLIQAENESNPLERDHLRGEAGNLFLRVKSWLVQEDFAFDDEWNQMYIESIFYGHLAVNQLDFTVILNRENTLFKAVSEFDEDSPFELKQRMMREITENIDEYKLYIELKSSMSFEKYLEVLAEKGTMGGELEREILERVLQRPILFYQYGHGLIASNNRNIKGYPIFVECYEKVNMYGAICPVAESYFVSFMSQQVMKSRVKLQREVQQVSDGCTILTRSIEQFGIFREHISGELSKAEKDLLTLQERQDDQAKKLSQIKKDRGVDGSLDAEEISKQLIQATKESDELDRELRDLGI